jgi:parallel beta-helix repeat protein
VQGIAYAQTTWTVVDLSSGLTYSTIQAAIDDANTTNGDMILVGSGIYRENVVVNKPLILIGQNTSNGLPVIDGNRGIGINITANGTTVYGFGLMDSEYGIYVTSDTNNVIQNIAYNNIRYGVYLNNSSYNTLRGNIVNGNGIAGIALYNSSNNNLIGNTANNNTNEGIILFNSSYNNLTWNTANNNDIWVYGMGIWLYRSHGNTLWLNTFQGNGRSAVCDCSLNGWNSASPMDYIYNGQTYTNYTGNYWDDYDGASVNGIGTTMHTVNNNNIDHYPMIMPNDLPQSTLNFKRGWNLISSPFFN